MSSKISEHFKLIDGKDIFTYYADVNNTKAISFNWEDATGVTPSGSFNTDQLLKLSAAMTEPEIVKQMNYKVTLNNNEECNFNYNVVFVNPFIPGVGKSVSINGNAIGTNTGETKPQVIVTDNSKQNIYSYSSTSKKLELSKVATDTYKLTESIVSVKYEPVEDKAWTDFTSQLTSGSTLSVDPTSGVVTWKNEGTTLAKDLEFKVKATVTFTDLSVVKCYITVNLTK